MMQAARSGVQNIAEGSLASATSKKTELKLTQVARASLEELKLDYEDYLRHKNLIMLKHDDPILIRFKALKTNTVQKIREWVNVERARKSVCGHGLAQTDNDQHGLTIATNLASDCLVANATLSLLNLACYLLDQQVRKLADDFTREGCFTERLYRVRKTNQSKDKGY